MIVVVLILILAGSVTGAAVQWMQGASFWGIALGYAGGGWAGLLLGLLAITLLRAATGLLLRLSPSRRRLRQHNDALLPAGAWARGKTRRRRDRP
ncbi:hypothetical protein [Paracoccus sp. 22332]|uniref:hypothetical protein n=1 Tax=Paracoccus sp. 22332 TaxID=3453913 RepID=UPI003F8651BE